jgi:hypothetical protein
MAETIKYIGAMIASKFGGPLDTYNFTGLSNKTAFRGYLAANQTGVADATHTAVLIDTEVYDLGNNFASYVYTCPIPGYYQADFVVFGWCATAHNMNTFFAGIDNFAGTHLLRGSRFGGTSAQNIVQGSSGSGSIYRAAGDTMKLAVYMDFDNDAATGTIEGGYAYSTSLSIYLAST